jgi:hypothetical protein
LFGNVGGPTGSRPLVDVGDAIDRLINGTSSLIHQHYLRKRADTERAHQRERERVEDQRRAEDRAERQAEREQRMAIERQKLEAKGYVPGSPANPVAGTRPATPTVDAPVDRSINAAMTRGMSGPMDAPAPQSSLTQPVTSGSLGSIPTITSQDAVAPHYDRNLDVDVQRKHAEHEEDAQALVASGLKVRGKPITIQEARALVGAGGIAGSLLRDPVADAIAVYRAKRRFDVENPPPSRAGGKGADVEKERRGFVAKRVPALMKTDIMAQTFGLPLEQATHQANEEADAIYGKRGAAAAAPAAATGVSGGDATIRGGGRRLGGKAAAAKETAATSGDTPGDVDLRTPAAPATPASGGPSATRHPLEAAGDAEQMIRNGKATLDQALASPYLSDEAKRLLKLRFPQ